MWGLDTSTKTRLLRIVGTCNTESDSSFPELYFDTKIVGFLLFQLHKISCFNKASMAALDRIEYSLDFGFNRLQSSNRFFYTESKYGGPRGWHGTSLTKSRLVRHRSQSFSHIYSGREAISTAINCITMHKCTEMYSEPERSSLRSETTSPPASVFYELDTSTVCRDYVELFSMNVNLKGVLHSLSGSTIFVSRPD